jgi:hypothetical protein
LGTWGPTWMTLGTLGSLGTWGPTWTCWTSRATWAASLLLWLCFCAPADTALGRPGTCLRASAAARAQMHVDAGTATRPWGGSGRARRPRCSYTSSAFAIGFDFDFRGQKSPKGVHGSFCSTCPTTCMHQGLSPGARVCRCGLRASRRPGHRRTRLLQRERTSACQ